MTRLCTLDNVYPTEKKLVKLGRTTADLNAAFLNAKAFEDFIPISKPKLENIGALLKAVALPHHATFYDCCFHQQY